MALNFTSQIFLTFKETFHAYLQIEINQKAFAVRLTFQVCLPLVHPVISDQERILHSLAVLPSIAIRHLKSKGAQTYPRLIHRVEQINSFLFHLLFRRSTIFVVFCSFYVSPNQIEKFVAMK